MTRNTCEFCENPGIHVIHGKETFLLCDDCYSEFDDLMREING